MQIAMRAQSSSIPRIVATAPGIFSADTHLSGSHRATSGLRVFCGPKRQRGEVTSEMTCQIAGCHACRIGQACLRNSMVAGTGTICSVQPALYRRDLVASPATDLVASPPRHRTDVWATRFKAATPFTSPSLRSGTCHPVARPSGRAEFPAPLAARSAPRAAALIFPSASAFAGRLLRCGRLFHRGQRLPHILL